MSIHRSRVLIPLLLSASLFALGESAASSIPCHHVARTIALDNEASLELPTQLNQARTPEDIRQAWNSLLPGMQAKLTSLVEARLRKNDLPQHYAEDIVQDTLFALIQIKNKNPAFQFDPNRGGLFPYMSKIASRRMWDLLRRRKNRPVQSLEDRLAKSVRAQDQKGNISDIVVDPATEFAAGTNPERLNDFLDRLPPNQAAVFRLLQTDKSPAEVASALSLPEAQVFRLLDRAEENIKEAFPLSPNEAPILMMTEAELRRALATLTPLQQEAVWRFHLQGMKQSQVATFLPEGAQVASAIYLGVRKLAGIPENVKEIKTPKLKVIREGEYHDWPGVTGPKAKHGSTPELRTKLELQKSLSVLPPEEKQALALRFGHAQSPEEIKEKLSLNSVAEVRFLMAKSLKALRLNPEDLAQHSQSLREIPLTSNVQEPK